MYLEPGSKLGALVGTVSNCNYFDETRDDSSRQAVGATRFAITKWSPFTNNMPVALSFPHELSSFLWLLKLET